jgi:hypothetical protein
MIGRSFPRFPRGQRLIVAVAAGLLGLPLGFAVAQDDAESGPSSGIPAAECGEDVVSAYAEAGIKVDGVFYPDCPTTEEARQRAFEIRDERRGALTRIASAMRKWGDETNAADLAEIETELERLGGVDPEEQREVDEILDHTLSPEEFERAQIEARK